MQMWEKGKSGCTGCSGGGAGLDGAMKMQSWQVDRKVMRSCFREGQKRACDALSSMVVTPA